MQQVELAATGPSSSLAVKLEAGVEADVAWWQHCVDVFNTLDAYVPARFLPAPMQLRQYYADLPALADDIAPTNGIYPALALALGQWRAHVTETEATNARRLEVVADVVRRLREMRDRAVDPRQVDDLIRQASQFIYAQYRAVPPEGAKLRLWCTRATRRHDLLPGEWRVL